MYKALKAIFHPLRLLLVLPVVVILFFISAGYAIGCMMGMLILGTLDYVVFKDRIEAGMGSGNASMENFWQSFWIVLPIVLLFDLLLVWCLYFVSIKGFTMVDFFMSHAPALLLCSLGGVIWASIGIKGK